MTTDDGDDYQISPQGYLARCRDRLREGTKAGIFYAALELRGCIEARHAEEAYREAWVACRGELPILPLWDSETGELVSFSIYISDDNRDDMEALGKAVGTPMEIDVKHLDAPPDDWICDL